MTVSGSQQALSRIVRHAALLLPVICALATLSASAQPVPSILVDKTATPLSRSAPGGSFAFDVVITNMGTLPVTITALTDDVYGDISTQGTCTTAIGTILPAGGGTYSCSFNGVFTGSAGDTQTDVVTANAVDSNGATATDTDDAVVSLTAPPPVTAISVDKTASPLSRPAPGGSFTFNVVITNTGTLPVTITALTDDVYGNIATQGTCTTAIGTVLPADGTYSCSFTGVFTGSAGDSQTDVVTANAVDSDGATATDSDDALVSITAPPPSTMISVDKTATPLTRPAPGGAFTFNVVITNTGTEQVTITAATDDVYGNIATQGTCTTAIGTVLAAGGGSYSCSFTGMFTGSAGATQTDVVTASASDDGGRIATDSDDAVVSITAPPVTTISVDKTATPLSRPAPGGSFTFNVVITNTGTETVTITALTDDVYGNIATQGTCTTAIGTVLPASGTYSCSFPGMFTGSAGNTQTDVVSANAVDSSGATATDSDDAVVSITAAPVPTISIDKTATPLTRPEPGGSFTFDVFITNTGAVPVTITSLTDNIYGNIATQGTCTTAIGTVIAASGGTYSCSFAGTFTGNAAASQTDIVTANAVDSLGAVATDTDDAVVTLTDAQPSIAVSKTASPTSLPAPGGTFTFAIVVSNTGAEPFTINSLTDDIYGNLGVVRPGSTCNTAPGTVVAPGGSYACSFTGNFTGSEGDTQTDIVTATVRDDESNVVPASGTASVTLAAPAVAIPLLEGAALAMLAAMLALMGIVVMRK